MSPTQRGDSSATGRPAPRPSILRPIDRVTEVLFGLIMVLTCTGSSAWPLQRVREDVRTMLISALGCNLAWGLLGSILYLMGCMAERSDGLRTLQRIQSTSADGARQMVSNALPPVVASVRSRRAGGSASDAAERAGSAGRARLEQEDWLGAAGVLL